MANKAVHLPVLNFGATMRKDAWWAGPAVTAVVLLGFIAYATFRAFENDFYAIDPYLSPFYSPLIPTAGFGIPFLSPAMLILPGPAGFRLTCYYYRKAYYRSLVMDPPACAVGERGAHKYNGETKLLLFQNLHRFALYVAVIFLAFLWHDVWDALWWPTSTAADAPRVFGVGMGTVVLFVNTSLLTLYTFSCHSWRHLVGGALDSFSTAAFGRLRHSMWRVVSKLNTNHMAFAWLSLFGVGLSDFYVRLVASGAVHDMRFF